MRSHRIGHWHPAADVVSLFRSNHLSSPAGGREALCGSDRRPMWFAILGAALVLPAGCSSGLGNNQPASPTAEATVASANLPTGFDPNVAVTAPPERLAAAGAKLPGIGGAADREAIFLAFDTTAPASDADGSGTPLAREVVADTNGASDVFVSVTVGSEIDTHAFSQSLAGKMRHPRCVTCHMMAATGTTAFASVPSGHAGPVPGPGFPNNDTATCAVCHNSGSTNFPVPGWQAPAESFDLRNATVANLAARAETPPGDESEHFVTDGRVLWALDSGILPLVGGGNGFADDDHDGVLEPEDTDTTPRTVPGGSAQFLEEFEAWESGAKRLTNAAATPDIALVSRLNGSATAGNGASRAADMVYKANSGFDDTNTASALSSNPMGWLYIAFESDATDLVAGDTNGATDVYWVEFEVRAEEDAQGNTSPGGINLQYSSNSITRVSSPTGGSGVGNAASSTPSIGGADGQFVAFESLATNLQAGFADGNGAGNPDVYVREIGSGDSTRLVSHVVGNAAQGCDGAATQPAIATGGDVVAYRSESTDGIVGDSNGVADVFYADTSGGAPFTTVRASVITGGGEAAGGDSSAPSVYSDGSGRVKVAFLSAKTDLVTSVGTTTNVFVHDSMGATTTLLNQRITPTTSNPVLGNGDAANPQISADGNAVVFESDATNLDVLRDDGNRSTDIILVELDQVESNGFVLPFRLNVTATSGAEADGGASEVAYGRFSDSTTYPTGFVAYRTDALNLGTSDNTDVMLSFLAESSGVTAAFTTSADKVASPFTVTFTDNSSGNPNSWAWDFDNDGNTDSTDQNPTFSFPSAGTYTVKLTASNDNAEGSTTSVIQAVGPLVADFTTSTTSGTTGLTVNFTDTTDQLPEGWSWDFDGDSVEDSTNQNDSFTYNVAGTYDVSLTATGIQGSDTVTRSGLIQVFNPVSASFTTSTSSGLAPLSVTFTSTSTGDIASLSWDFDGDMVADSTSASDSFTYSAGGSFDASLTVQGQGGDSDTSTTTITVSSGISFSKTANSAYTGNSITYTPTPVANATQYEWDLDGDSVFEITRLSTDPNFNTGVSETYNTPATVTVRFRVTTPSNTLTTTDSVTIVASSITAPVLNPSGDTTIFSDTTAVPVGSETDSVRTNNSAGGQSSMYVGYIYNGGGSDIGNRRALVKFDLSGASIPSGATILTASFQVTIPSGGFGTHNLAIHRLNQDWGEGTVSVGSGRGSEANTGDATWNSARHNVTNWTNGGNFQASATETETNITTGTVTWNSSGVISDVQDWVDGTTNAGWIIISSLENGGTSPVARKISSRTGSNPPTLSITYRPPLP